MTRQNQELQISNTKAAAEIADLNDRLLDRIGEVKGLEDAQTKARQQFEHYQQSIAEQRAEEPQQKAQQMARLELELT